MASADPLWDLYEDWKELTELERRAIETSNWVEVRRCQRAKEQLQPKIIRITDRLKAEATGAERDELNARIRSYANELIQMESKNSSTLDQRMSQIEGERAELEGTSQRLRKVQKSYVPAAAPLWNQYS